MLGGLVFTTSCDKENVNPPAVVQENNVANGRIKMVYSVQVLPSSKVEGGKTAGITDAEVTISANGKTMKTKVGEDGIAIFNDIMPGTINGYVKAANYSTLSFTSELNPTVTVGDSDQVQFAASKVYLYPRTASLFGRIYGNFALSTGSNLEIRPNNPIYQMPADGYVRVVYNTDNYKMGSGLGKLTSVSLEPNIIRYNTESEGKFEISGLYPTEDGTISARLILEDYSKQMPTSEGNRTVVFRFSNAQSTTYSALRLNAGSATVLGDILVNYQ